ncbi:MAG: hypothetical protein SP4CHLAM5_00980 [Chlamydiia bacterium]|nr:hypothetical protein [Chlamydiia bacterium]MCH9617974.1 hypothetical protein [Chlamydiia bacterium]MCH9623701.1 hypothetical protein [Chlamydiia bacterium]
MKIFRNLLLGFIVGFTGLTSSVFAGDQNLEIENEEYRTEGNTQLDEALQQFFSTDSFDRILLTLHDENLETHKIGVLFDPVNGYFDLQGMKMNNPVLIVTPYGTPKALIDLVKRKIPADLSCSVFCCGSFNGTPVLEYFGFE